MAGSLLPWSTSSKLGVADGLNLSTSAAAENFVVVGTRFFPCDDVSLGSLTMRFLIVYMAEGF
jgi:hypothetical protein